MSQDLKLENLIRESVKNVFDSQSEDIQKLISNVARFASITGMEPSNYFRLIKRPLVSDMTTLSAPSVYRKVGEKEIPSPIKITPNGRSSAWVYGECILWVHDRVTASRNGEAE